MPIVPSLYGLKKTNRDYTKKETFGKNQFNSRRSLIYPSEKIIAHDKG